MPVPSDPNTADSVLAVPTQKRPRAPANVLRDNGRMLALLHLLARSLPCASMMVALRHDSMSPVLRIHRRPG